ncbi:hypothetical protein [Paenibacillus abyssi]|uniref:Uncharacterized protein n=1 Tax=Paenibacillus abyssi TaxID=1340531 RepID=A0A917LGZ7_9BACL|nr:hypothetical protein [Paenibacillus abyssi]GGG22221.1 hypothetical protein GCM10010916_43580 [Paenibacillus abyssi]
MKLSKKAVTALSFTIGACVFISTAFADMALGSGYDQLKGSIKNTAAQMEKGLNNYTIETLITLKDNGQTMVQTSTLEKIDNEKQASERSTTTQQTNGETRTNYSYTDQKFSVWKSGEEDKYYVMEYPVDSSRENWNRFDNPFNQSGAAEIEKIVDALVGGLKDYVQVEERPEGGRAYSGSLSEAQVPAAVNAVSSFGIKQLISDQSRMERDSKLPQMESDIFVKKVSGTAVENNAGLLEKMTGDVTLSGIDKSGAQHDITLNVVLKLSDIGNTQVAMPDLTGANIEKVSQSGGFSSKHVGTYQNNIVIEKDGEFVKIGERILEITSVENKKVTGKYYETVKPGFEAEYPNAYNFSFEYTPDNSNPMSFFTYTNAQGEQENGQIHPNDLGMLYLDLNVEIMDEHSYRSNVDIQYFNGEFNRVFEE